VSAALASAALEDGRQGARWSWPADEDLAVMLHPIASAAADLLVSPELLLVKRCARCPWLFLDRSKNHSRRWCDMNDCGRAQKIERYVARRAARRASGGAD
jgi:predicted RNA-binding Zn ribbon-like protein